MSPQKQQNVSCRGCFFRLTANLSLSFPLFEYRLLVCAKVLSVDWKIYPAMPPQSKRVQETESTSSAPKRIRGSAANWGRAGFEADSVMKSHCFMAERIPEGTRRRHRTISGENAVSDCGIGTSASPDSRGSDRVVANSNDHEIRRDDD